MVSVRMGLTKPFFQCLTHPCAQGDVMSTLYAIMKVNCCFWCKDLDKKREPFGSFYFLRRTIHAGNNMTNKPRTIAITQTICSPLSSFLISILSAMMVSALMLDVLTGFPFDVSTFPTFESLIVV